MNHLFPSFLTPDAPLVFVSEHFLLSFRPSGNDSSVDGLVNFEKLRMIAKEIRHVVRLTSANMDPALMFRQRLVVDASKPLQIDIQFHRSRSLKNPILY